MTILFTKVATMSDMKCLIKCPMCGEVLQKYGEIDPDAGTSIVLGANCHKCGIGNSDIKLWQELIRTKELLDIESSEHEMCHTQMLKTTEKLECTRKALEIAVDALKWIHETYNLCMGYEAAIMEKCEFALEQITALEQKDVK